MDKDPRSRRASLFDSESPQQLMNEFLLAIFLPGITLFVLLWAVFRLYLDEVLLSFGLGRVIPDQLPFIAIESGYGRFLLLVLLTALIVFVYLTLYIRVLRRPLKEREVV